MDCSLGPWPPPFFVLCSLFCVQYNTRKLRSGEKCVFRALPLPCFTECKAKNKIWGRPGSEAMDFAYGMCAV